MLSIVRRRLSALALISVLALLLAACGAQPAAQPTAPMDALAAPTAAPAVAAEPLSVIATYSILGDLVANVAGDLVDLTTLVGPGGDPHVYEPTPRDSATLAEADLLFENGLEFEPWIDALFAASGAQATRVAVTDQITPLPFESHDHEDPLVHACEHFADAPTTVAAATDAASAVAIPEDHTHYLVTLAGGAGLLTLSRDEDGDVSFFLGADVPFAVLAGAVAQTPEALERISEGCDAVAIVYTFDLEPGAYTLSFGPGAGDSVALVWEAAGHDEAAHSEDEATHSEDEAAHSEDEHGHEHGEYDPHVWQDPNNAMIMVEAIRDALAAADPANAATYAANAAAYLAELEALDAFVTEQVAALPEERRKLVTSHDTFGYFADRYGFAFIGTALGTTTESSDPAAGAIAELVEQIRAAGVPAIFAENTANSVLMETIAREAGVELAPPLFTDALSEPGSEGATYLEMIRFNVTTIVTALAG